jgi:hypothetical protein
VDGPTFDHLVRTVTRRWSRRGVLGVLAGLTGVRPAEATAKRGDSKHRVRASSYDEKVVVCLRVGNGTHRRIKVAQRAARKLLSKHGNFRFVDCCVDRDCKDGKTCGA